MAIWRSAKRHAVHVDDGAGACRGNGGFRVLLGVLLFMVVGYATAQDITAVREARSPSGSAAAGALDATPATRGLPYDLRPGDVLVNAPLGVLRYDGQPRALQLFAPAVGVVRTSAPLPRVDHLFSPQLGVHRGSAVESIEPRVVAIGVDGQTVEIRGTGLVGLSAVAVVPTEGVAVVDSVEAADGRSVVLQLDVAAAAQPGLRKLLLHDANGVLIPARTPEAAQLMLATPQPIIYSVSPSLLAQGGRYEVVLRGRFLRGLPFLSPRDVEQPTVDLLPADGIAIDAVVEATDDGTEVRFDLAVAPDALLVPRVVQVHTASGSSSSDPTPYNTVQIAGGQLVPRSPVVSPLLGIARGSPASIVRTLTTPALGVVRGAVVTDMSPDSVERGEAISLDLTGVGLATVTAIELQPADGLVLDADSLQVSETGVSISLVADVDAPLVPRRVTAISGEARLQAPTLLDVRDAVPVVTALTPNYLLRNGLNQTVELQGEALSQTTAARLLPDTGIVIEDYQPLDSSRARLVLRAQPQAAIGPRVVRVLAPVGSSSGVPSAGNTLDIVDRNQILTPFVSPLLGVSRGSNAADADVPVFSSAVGVVRGPVAERVAPDRLLRGRTTRVRIEGRGLNTVQDVQLLPEDGVLFANIDMEQDGSAVEVDVVVASDAEPGSRRIRLLTGDGEIGFSPALAAILTIAGNQSEAPTAEDDHYAGYSNSAISVSAPEGVLANDFDPGGAQLFAVLRRVPANGVLSLQANGGFTYTPNPDFSGVDRFEYSAGSPTAVGNVAVVTLVISERDDAVDDSYSVADNQVLAVTAANGLLANDQLAVPDGAEIVLQSQPMLGDLQLQQDGSFAYTPNGQGGDDAFSYRLRSEQALSLPATVRITVIAINEAPVASDDAYVVDRGGQLMVAAGQGALQNDSDPDDDPLIARLVSNTAVGSLSLAQNGSFTFTPPADFVGQTAFVYEAVDPAGLADQASVTITINETLTAQADQYEMPEGEVLFVDEIEGLLANDSVFPQGALRIVLDREPTRGDVQIGNDGSFVYTPRGPDTFGEDSFTYYLQDDAVSSPSADVRIRIVPNNDPPRPRGDRYLTDENVQLDVPAPGLLSNDVDVDSEVLTAELLLPPEHGTVSVDADGSFRYVPAVNFRGEDVFSYLAIDDQGAAGEAEVTIEVTQPPTATNDVYLVDVDTRLDVVDPAEGLLANDRDAPENDELSAILSSPPPNGAVELASDGTFSYTPDDGFVGLDVFTYRATDQLSLSNVATVTMGVGITSLPRAFPDAYELDEDTELVVNADLGLLANDTDADTPHPELEAYAVWLPWQGLTPLDVTVNLDGSFRVRPWRDFTGETSFVYQVYDGRDISNAAVVELVVHPVNDGVLAEDDEFGVLRNTVFVSDDRGHNSIVGNDVYDSDFSVEYAIADMPAYGLVELDPVSGVFSYTPQQDFSGLDTFVYRVTQSATGISDTATVSIRVNSPPELRLDEYIVDEDSVTDVWPDPLDNDFDADGDPIYFQSLRVAKHGNDVEIRVDDRFDPGRTTVITSQHFYGTRLLRYRATDGVSESVGDIVANVLPVPDDPISTVDRYLTQRNTPLAVNEASDGVLDNDFDPDRQRSASASPWEAATGLDLQPLVAELVTDVEHGTLTFTENGLFYYVPEPDFSGVDHFTYRALDATGRYGEATLVEIRVNTPSVAAADGYVATEDVLLEVSVEEGLLANDFDEDGDAMQAYFAHSGCSPCNGSVQVRLDGSFRYTPNRDFYGTDEFFYTARDGINGSDTGRVAITVLPVNDPPLTEADTYRTREDEVLVAPEPQGILRNDREVDGDELVDAELVTAADHGSVALQPDGSFTYTPEPDFNGYDTFEYRVFDTTGLSSEELVEVFVTSVNDAPVAEGDAYSTTQDAELVVGPADGVLANDSDVDGPSLSASLIGPPAHGAVDLAADGSFVYQPDGFHAGIDTFQYQVDDGLGALAIADVVIQVTPVEPEVEVFAESDFYRFIGPRLAIDAPGVLVNDRVDGSDLIEATVVLAPEIGSVVLAPDGGFEFVAPDGFVGVTGFTYAASSEGVSATARVMLDVQQADNVPPQAQGEVYAVLEDGLLDSRQIASLLENDSDFEGSPLTLLLDEEPAHGVLQLLDGGHFTYQPDPDYNGRDDFRYRVSDGELSSLQVSAEITVYAQNDAPVARDDAYHGDVDQLLQVPEAEGVLSNDYDADADPLLVELVEEPLFGQLQMDPAGGFSYQPLPGFSGQDSFRYAASDLLALSLATVTLNISDGNQPPEATGEQFVIDEDAVLDSAEVGALTANDTDPDGDELTVLVEAEPMHGTLTLDGDNFRYVPDSNHHGTDQFLYRVSDGEFSSDPVAADILIEPVNDAPTVEADLYVTERDQALTMDGANGVLANDEDVEGDALSAAVEAAPAFGALTLATDGSFTYQPQPGFVGRDEFAYSADDGADSATGRAVIDVVPSENARPVALGEQFTLSEDTVLDTADLPGLLDNDLDPDGLPLALEIIDEPAIGTLEWLDGDHFRYTPQRDFAGSVEIVYSATDGELSSEPVSARIDFLPQNDAPQPQADVYMVPPAAPLLDVPATIGVLANDIDVDGDEMVASVLRQPQAGTLWLGLDGALRFTPDEPRPPEDSFRYLVSDAAGGSAEAEVLLLMDPALMPPGIFSDSFEQAKP